MSDPFIGEIRMFAGNFAPRNYAFCEGQLLSISSNTALFSLLGTTYGGDGRTTFGLPDMRGRIPVHQGTGAGLPPFQIGQKAGVENVTLNANQIPSHTHTVQCANKPGNAMSPVGAYPAIEPVGITALYSDQAPDANSKCPAVSSVGGQAHSNVQPFQCISFIIALQGLYPSRN